MVPKYVFLFFFSHLRRGDFRYTTILFEALFSYMFGSRILKRFSRPSLVAGIAFFVSFHTLAVISSWLVAEVVFDIRFDRFYTDFCKFHMLFLSTIYIVFDRFDVGLT